MNTNKNQGVNPRGVFNQLLKEDHSFDPTQIKVFDLKFAVRRIEIGPEGGGLDQVVSILDTGHGKIDVFPLVQRFQPKPGKVIRCYVTFREGERMDRGRPKKVTRGFAIPVDLRGAHRDGIWLGLRNNILNLTFRPSNREEGGWVASGPNGKLAILTKDAGFEPGAEAVSCMVSEAMNCFIVHCKVLDEEANDTSTVGEQSLIMLAEAVGATLDGVDIFGLNFGGRLYDACEVLGLSTSADAGALQKRYRELAKIAHPDKQAQKFEATTGTKPTSADTQIFNYEWSLINAAKERFELHLTRESARKKYLEKGRKAQPKVDIQSAVKDVAKLLKVTVTVARSAAKKIGYPVKSGRDTISQAVAWTIAGLIASGYNPDDLSDEKSEDKPASAKPATPAEPAAPAPTEK